jgi:hypothetical protein
MNLNGYMNSAVGFGVYGEEYHPEAVELTDEDLAPLDSTNRMSWITPSQFSGLGGAWAETKGTILGLGAGILTGLAANALKEHLVAHPILEAVIAPASASITTLVIYWLVS